MPERVTPFDFITRLFAPNWPKGRVFSFMELAQPAGHFSAKFARIVLWDSRLLDSSTTILRFDPCASWMSLFLGADATSRELWIGIVIATSVFRKSLLQCLRPQAGRCGKLTRIVVVPECLAEQFRVLGICLAENI